MKVTCQLVLRVERQGCGGFIWGTVFDLQYHEIDPKNTCKFFLQIKTVETKDLTSKVLTEVEVERGIKGKGYHISFYTVGYVYLSESDHIYCTTLIQKI